MKAVLLATNEIKKLAPLSASVPPAMLPVANQPVILYTIDMLARQGYKNLVVCLHNQAGAIESYFRSGQRWGINLEYALQRDALGSAGALGWARNLLTETVLVLPADILLDLDIPSLLEQHRQQGNAATVVLHPARSLTGRSGKIRIEPDCGEPPLMDGMNRSIAREWCSIGVCVLEPQALSLIPPRTPFDLMNQLIPALIEAGLPVGEHHTFGYWNPLRTCIDYQKAQEDFLRSTEQPHAPGQPRLKFLQLNSSPLRPGIWIGRNSTIHPSAHLTPPVLIGENCRIGRNVELGPDAVVGANSIVDDGATVRSSVIFENTYLGRLVNVENRVVQPGHVVDIPTGESVAIVDPQLISATPKTVDQSLLRRWLEAALALILLVLSLPLTLPLALLVGLLSGRVFEPVTRVHPARNQPGERGFETFRLLRFATGRRGGGATPISRWVERWEIQRLPELWNVVNGTLRLVGVHPAAPEEVNGQPLPWQQALRDCPPGFTGLWFVQTGPDSTIDEIQLADAYYNATRSWSNDFAILRQTPSAWVRRARQGAALALAGHHG